MRSSQPRGTGSTSVSLSSQGRLPKTSDDYIRALGRGWWFLILMTAAVGGAGTWFTLTQTPVYLASTQVLIEPPRAIVPDLIQDRSPSGASINFFNTRVQMITSREILHRVLTSRALTQWKETSGVEDPLESLIEWVTVKPVLNSNIVEVSLEGYDPAVTAMMVNLVVEEFILYEENNLRQFEQLSRSKIESEVRNLKSTLENKQKELASFHQEHDNFTHTGESVEAVRLEELEKTRLLAEMRANDARIKVEQFEALLKANQPFYTSETMRRAEDLRTRIRELESELSAQQESIKEEWYDTDPLIRRLRNRRAELLRSLDDLGKEDAQRELVRLKQEYQFAALELDKVNGQVAEQRKLVVSKQADQKQLEALRGDHERLLGLADRMTINELEVDMHQSLITPRIQAIDRAQVPTEPVRPIKELQIPLSFVAGLLLGMTILCALEFSNQRVRQAEQATLCLAMPILGFVPKLSRRERLQWGGTLRLASEQPGSRVCETFRNLRSGLMGIEGAERARCLVLTSPTTGEGKSLVASNLAATCARAGETVLLVDMDLRHPRLASALGLKHQQEGLVEVLTGESRWQESVQETAVPNLHALPAGQGEGIPLDILGTVEMHDLIEQWSEEFDRVILDGPPLLGLADVRVVSRFADGMILTIDAGKHQAATLVRVRELCENEGLGAMGVVFNRSQSKHDRARVNRTPAGRSKRMPAVRQTVPVEQETEALARQRAHVA
ncbi:polysaccharide biosynthesis tyrosine autokinase [bacterium]|nr:polysaccharide biosynthesis tyrosine autokinase [bacterium]